MLYGDIRENREMKMLGSSKISYRLRISLPKDAADILKADDGDFILFYVNDEGEVVLKKG